jgi:flagellar hook assembly protein FlgD
MSIRIYNALGIEIATIADADYDAGAHIFEWNATDIPNGVYGCRMESGGKSVISQIIVTK